MLCRCLLLGLNDMCPDVIAVAASFCRLPGLSSVDYGSRSRWASIQQEQKRLLV